MRSFFVALALLLFTPLAFAGTPPPDYLSKTGWEKQAFHRSQGILHRYDRLPRLAVATCAQSVAFMENFSAEKLRRTFTEPSGYADTDDHLRKDYGKGIHSRGPMASGSFEINERIMGLEPGTYPVTIRFSLANPYFFPGGPRYRPGFLIMIHRGPGLEDFNLVMMPPEALDGYLFEQNPFALPYTHWLEKPWPHIQVAAAMTFGRVCQDVYTQYLTENELRNYDRNENSLPTRRNSRQIVLAPDPYWAGVYKSRRHQGSDYRGRFEAMFVEEEQPPLFIARVHNGDGVMRTLGEIRLTHGFQNSYHSDQWFARHMGFILKN